MLVFVYGTLTDAERASELLETFAFRGQATLEGLHRVEGTYPTLAPGGSIDGHHLETEEVAALDDYEGVDRGLYVRVDVPIAGEGTRSAAVYVGDSGRLHAPAEWPGDGPFAGRVRDYVAANEVVVVRSSER